MDLTTIIIYLVGGVLVIYFLLYVFTAQNILGHVLKKPRIKIIERSHCPQYLKDLFESKEKELIDLGFSYIYCIVTDHLYVKKYPQKYAFVYYNQKEKSYAELTESDAADNVIPIHVTFSTHFADGKRLLTFNGLKHSVMGTLPDTILHDAYAETLEKQFRSHLEHLAATAGRECEIEEFPFHKPLNPGEIIEKETRNYENYLKKLEKDGYIYKVDEDKYLIKTMASIRFAHRIISGLRKIVSLRNRIIKQTPAKQTDLPVELEVTNYLNTRTALNQQTRNTGGKIFFLILSVALFAAAFSLIISFEFVLILIGVIFLHESGHLLAMRLFGYKNLRMLFIPLFGAVAMGTDKDVAPYKKVITYFAGPVPGILLAFLFILTWQNTIAPLVYSPTLLTIVLVLIFVNYFNLIPIMPFDGGQIFNTIIFSRFPVLQLIFNVISLTAVLLLAVILQSPLLFFVALVIFLGLQQFFTQKRIMEALKKDQELKNKDALPEKDMLKKIFLFLKEPPYNRYPFQKKFRIVQNLESSVNTKKASKKTVVFTLIFYLFLFAVPVIFLISPIRNLGSLFGLHPGNFKDPCQVIQDIPKLPVVEGLVEKADFQRLPGTTLDSPPFMIYRTCFVIKDSTTSPFAGDFLGRIQAYYGKPDESSNGFSYAFLDRKTGVIFTAHVKSGIPAYASREKNNQTIGSVLYRFEALLKKTEPIDCRYVYKDADGNTYEIGSSGGEPYFDMVRPSGIDRKKIIPNPVALSEPVTLAAGTLDHMLYVYTAFFAIGHDRWLASESSMVKTKIEVSGLPSGLSGDELLELFPIVKKVAAGSSVFFKVLSRPKAGMMQGGVYPDPGNNRLLLLQGASYTQDGYGQLARYLEINDSTEGNGPFDIAVEMEFFPGDYEDPGDLGDFFLYLKGNITGKNIEITHVDGAIATQSQINDLFKAAELFARFEAIIEPEYRFTAADEAEAKAVRELYVEVAGGKNNIVIDGQDIIIKNRGAYDLGLVVAYTRYGRKVFNKSN